MQKDVNDIQEYVFCDSLSGLNAAYELGFSTEIKVLTRSPAILEALPFKSIDLDKHANVAPGEIHSFFLGTSSSLLDIKNILESVAHLASYSTLVCRELWNWQQHALFSIFLSDNDFRHPRYWIKAEYESDRQTEQFTFNWGALLRSSPHFTTITAPAKACSDHKYGGAIVSYRELFALGGKNPLLWRLMEKLWELTKI